MNATKTKGPIARSKVGRFEVALFRFDGRRVDSNDTERVTSYERVCLTYSRYRNNEGRYENAQIWCYPEELRDLAQAMDELAEVQPPVAKKEEVSSSSSQRSEVTVSVEPVQITWANAQDLTDGDREAMDLDEAELDRLQHCAEHPEFADPLMAFLSRGRRDYGSV